jgi:hypothetical protein
MARGYKKADADLVSRSRLAGTPQVMALILRLTAVASRTMIRPWLVTVGPCSALVSGLRCPLKSYCGRRPAAQRLCLFEDTGCDPHPQQSTTILAGQLAVLVYTPSDDFMPAKVCLVSKQTAPIPPSSVHRLNSSCEAS